MLTLRTYQEEAVRDLFAKSLGLLDRKVSRPLSVVFKSPTWSWKTVMMQEYLRRLSEIPGKRLAFVWLSIGDIAGQSKRSFVKNLEGSKLRFSELSDVANKELSQNEILFVNWEKLNKKSRAWDWKVRAMRDNETEENLPTYLENARKSWTDIVLVVDESHRNLASNRAQEIIQEYVKPRLQIEVSATPDSSDPDEKVTVEPEDVIEAGMIRREAVMNAKIWLFAEKSEGTDTLLIRSAIEKRNELLSDYQSLGSGVKPLVLVQLPNDGEKASELDKTKLDHTERILAESFGITRENGKLAVWLSDDKTDNLEGIEDWSSAAEVLIFKQAIAIGWDCPRAQILVMFREIRSFTFSIQVIGRILRTPEQKHYGDAALDSAYVYTDLPRALLTVDSNVKGYFKTKNANRVADWNGFSSSLPVERAVRKDYGDVGYSFYAVLSDELLRTTGGTSGDFSDNVSKLGKFVDTCIERLSENLLTDWRIALDVDEKTERMIESSVDVAILSEDERVQLAFDDFIRRNVRPHFGNVARSYPVMKEALYSALEKHFFGKGVSRLKLQAVVLNSKAFFEGIFERAKSAYLPERASEVSRKSGKKKFDWNVSSAIEFPETAEIGDFKRYAFEPAFVDYDSKGERCFVERYLENPKIPILRWYKNGVSSERYFSIPYEYLGKTANFYPDFIVAYEDGTIGIYDTKDGFTLETDEARAKHGALRAYLKSLGESGISAKWGFVVNHWSEDDPRFYVTEDEEYVSNGTEGFASLR